MSIFDRIVVGVEGTEWGYEALRQALALCPPGGVVDAVTALDVKRTAQTGFLATHAAEQLEREADVVRNEAESIASGHAGFSARIVHGDPTQVLRDASSEATMLAVGGRRSSRFLGIMLGSTGTALVHQPSCAVLVARPQWGNEWHPRRIVVGLDGSVPALAALAVADELSTRLGSILHVVAATGGKVVDENEGWAERVDAWEPGDPVVTLLDRSLHADLVLVGARGVHGARALGSVSERVAHRAHCSVLVVPDPIGDVPAPGPRP